MVLDVCGIGCRAVVGNSNTPKFASDSSAVSCTKILSIGAGSLFVEGIGASSSSESLILRLRLNGVAALGLLLAGLSFMLGGVLGCMNLLISCCPGNGLMIVGML